MSSPGSHSHSSSVNTSQGGYQLKRRCPGLLNSIFRKMLQKNPIFGQPNRMDL